MTESAKSLLLPSLKIDNYRGLNGLNVSTLGRVNLLVGDNNVGKTSLLEAVWLWAARGDYEIIEFIIDYRNESSAVLNNFERSERRGIDFERKRINTLLSLSALYTGFPESFSKREPVVISVSQSDLILDYQPNRDVRQLSFLKELENVDSDSFPSLSVSFAGQDLYQVGSLGRGRLRLRQIREDALSVLPTIHFVPTGSIPLPMTSNGKLWDKTQFDGRQEEVIEGVRIIDPNVEDIFLVSDEFQRRSVIPICRHKKYERPISLGSMGEGMTKLFNVFLKLLNAKDGVLLIDEFENGLHYTIQAKAWEMIFRMAEKLNVQVFATTHSADAVRAFQQVAMQQIAEKASNTESNDIDDNIEPGVIVCLERLKNGNVAANPFFGQNLELMLETGREMR